MADKYIYFFGGGKADGDAGMRDVLGGKGANLAEMNHLGIPVPPGFTIATEMCFTYYRNKNTLPPALIEEIRENMKKVEAVRGMKFGDPANPLLLSVRSGAPVSMPGMMDTVLNLGLNNETVEGMIKLFDNEAFPLDSYRRFVQMFANVVMGIEMEIFEFILADVKERKGKTYDNELEGEDLREIVTLYLKAYEEQTGQVFPADPFKQLELSIGAVFNSWYAKRAVKYRQLNRIPDDMGTAVNVQAMVFGNLNDRSATGVAFTRDPATGDNRFFGEFLVKAQGEDVVAGIRTPKPINIVQKMDDQVLSMEEEMPELYGQLVAIYQKLERHYKEMQDLEFTIEDGTLYLLQTRTGKRTAQAALKIAVDMVAEGLKTEEEALISLEAEQLDQLLHPVIDPEEAVEVTARGLPASPGAAVGQIVFTAEEAEKAASVGQKVILVRDETSPEDVGGMNAAQGILTAKGGMTSHAAVVARGMGKCCVAGCSDIRIGDDKLHFAGSETVLTRGDYLTLNGTTGDVIVGQVRLISREIGDHFAVVMAWADKHRKLDVRTNADTPKDALQARKFGAQGIGLCRTEHMFFGEERLPIARALILRALILASNDAERNAAIEKLMPFQQKDFEELFRVMEGLPVTIRLLDPPLHEFIPKEEQEFEAMSKQLGIPAERIRFEAKSLQEMNPMLGHRGCRLGITFPEIYRMQVRAIFRAAVDVLSEGITVQPEVMIPLVGHVKEFITLKAMVVEEADRVLKEAGASCAYHVGTMIEVPRAAVTADQIGAEADFFSFGTNDLTQMGYGLSRDDMGKFLPAYLKNNIFTEDPFQVLDEAGIGQLVRIGVEKGRGIKADLKIGICGEHGGEPRSIDFCHRTGLDYVSCSPYRVPIARLAAARSAVLEKQKG
jgi:pyruvate,orthophosphate dikinase